MKQHENSDVGSIIRVLRTRNRRAEPGCHVYANVGAIRDRLRDERKNIIGSYVPLTTYLQINGTINHSLVEDLSHYLSAKAVALWPDRPAKASEFCGLFFSIALCAIAGGGVGEDSADDIILFSECLVRSRDVFVRVAKNLLPPEIISDLFALTEHYAPEYFSSNFEDAVLGAVSVFLGSLEDPISVNETTGEAEQDV